MDKQIENWGIKQYMKNISIKKPYLDLSTVEKVLADQDYNIVSIKIDNFELEKELARREEQHNEVSDDNRNADKIVSLLNHELGSKKVELYERIGSNSSRYQVDIE